MQVIIQHDEKVSRHLGQYAKRIESHGKNYKTLEIQDKYLDWLTEMTHYIEPDFMIELCEEEEWGETTSFLKEPMILASVGLKRWHRPLYGYYNITTHSIQRGERYEVLEVVTTINCYSDQAVISASDYIKCIAYLMTKAKEMSKPIVIYVNMTIPQEMYRYRALTHKIVNEYLTQYQSVLFIKGEKDAISKYYSPSTKAYEFYLEKTIYMDKGFEEVIQKTLPFKELFKGKYKIKEIYKDYRQQDSLYNDVFYQSIPEDQEIYVLLSSVNYKEPEYYEKLGVEAVNLISDYSVLYAPKRVFDANSEAFKLVVSPRYYMPVISYETCCKNVISKQAAYQLVSESLPYKGRGVYIGVVDVIGVDYTSQDLRNKDGTTRIAFLWEQIRAGEGRYYFKEQINEALASEDPGQIIQIPKEDNMTNAILSIAGGKDEALGYSGVATEAEFLVAKINPAPENIQKIYGGIPNERAVIMPDAMIGATRLVDFANEKGKPIVLCMPHNGNIDPHDGSLSLNQILSYIGQLIGNTIITPSGDEGDKMHHQGVEGEQDSLKIVNMRVDKESQNVVGVIYQRLATISSILLYPPENTNLEIVDLKKAGITYLNRKTTVYSNGERLNYSNGAKEILFRIDNPHVGGWRMEINIETGEGSQVDIWLAQQELNAYSTLRPSNPFITIGSTASTLSVMTVGGYDRETMVVLKTSGRGYNWNAQVKPLFITHGRNIPTFFRNGELARLTSTLASASIMLGVVATLYNKFIEEGYEILPNTLIMNNIILGTVTQFDGVEYPNQSQGYGVFELQALESLLATPFIF